MPKLIHWTHLEELLFAAVVYLSPSKQDFSVWQACILLNKDLSEGTLHWYNTLQYNVLPADVPYRNEDEVFQALAKEYVRRGTTKEQTDKSIVMLEAKVQELKTEMTRLYEVVKKVNVQLAQNEPPESQWLRNKQKAVWQKTRGCLTDVLHPNQRK